MSDKPKIVNPHDLSSLIPNPVVIRLDRSFVSLVWSLSLTRQRDGARLSADLTLEALRALHSQLSLEIYRAQNGIT